MLVVREALKNPCACVVLHSETENKGMTLG